MVGGAKAGNGKIKLKMAVGVQGEREYELIFCDQKIPQRICKMSGEHVKLPVIEPDDCAV